MNVDLVFDLSLPNYQRSKNSIFRLKMDTKINWSLILSLFVGNKKKMLES